MSTPKLVSINKIIPDYKKTESNFDSWDVHCSNKPWDDPYYLAENLVKDRYDFKPYNFFKLFKDQIVVDLGCGGQKKSLYNYLLFCLMGAKSYIGVDLHHANHLISNLKEIGQLIEPEMPNINFIPMAIINTDMYSFLLGTPDNSVSLYSSHMDFFVMQWEEYKLATEKEMKRVLSPNKGVFIKSDSFLDLQGENIKMENTLQEECRVYRKIQN